jgi:hypothetical protein
MGGFVHLELNTGDLKRAKSFYTKVFGWKTTDMKMPSGVYTMLDVQGPGGGMQKKPMDDAPTTWVPYIAVDDVNAVVAKAKKAGAQAPMPYFQVEGMGEGAVLVDPTGAAFGVWKQSMSAASTASSATKKAGKKKAAKKRASKKKAAKSK